MNYKFPVIEHIDQVREAIKGRTEFQEYNRGTHIVFNYHVNLEDSFPPVKTSGGSAKMREQAEFNKAVRRECRGLIFSPEGKVISRRLHKFFNLNEREETQEYKIDWNQEYTVLEKLDGSMVTPLWINGKLHWATKMGITDIGEQCKKFVESSRISYNKYFDACYDDYTPIFEYMSPQTRIVIEHTEPSLTLLALRHNITGEYVPYNELITGARLYDIPTVKPSTLEDIRNRQDTEGVVIRFNDGHMVKVKTDWYVKIHKAKENLLFEKNIIKLILEEKLDDILPHLPDNDKNKILNYKHELLNNINAMSFLIDQRLANYVKTLTKKDYATRFSIEAKDGPFEKQIIFGCWDKNVEVRDAVIAYILRHTNSQSQVNTIRNIIGVEWKG